MKTVFLVAASLLLTSSMATAQCGGDSSCAVGALGTGGAASGGNAQGSYEKRPAGRDPAETLTNAGNPMAGRLGITNYGYLSGTGATVDNVVRGHGTGIFGDWSGLCTAEDFEAGIC